MLESAKKVQTLLIENIQIQEKQEAELLATNPFLILLDRLSNEAQTIAFKDFFNPDVEKVWIEIGNWQQALKTNDQGVWSALVKISNEQRAQSRYISLKAAYTDGFIYEKRFLLN